MRLTGRYIIALSAAAVALSAALPSCKPSEKNYKAAYELAQQRDRENLDDEIYAKLKTEGMPKLLMYGSDSVYLAPKEPLLIMWQPGSANKSVTTAPPFNLIVGDYRNPSNAHAHAMQFMPPKDEKERKEKLRKGETVVADSVPAGWDWYPMVLVQGAENHYYVAIAHGDSVEALLPTLRLFKKKKLPVVGASAPIVRTRR